MINYKNIITKEEINKIDQEKYEYAISEGEFHANYLKRQYTQSVLNELLAARAVEIATIGKKYEDESKEVRKLIAANIAFPDSKKIINILLSKGITYDKFSAYIRVISGLKKLALKADELELDESITIADRKVNSLCSLIKLHTGIADYTLTLTKFNEIASRCEDLYIELQQNQKVR